MASQPEIDAVRAKWKALVEEFAPGLRNPGDLCPLSRNALKPEVSLCPADRRRLKEIGFIWVGDYWYRP